MTSRIPTALLALSLCPGCGSNAAPPRLAAAALASGPAGALAASSGGELLVPIVERGKPGVAAPGIRGVLWHQGENDQGADGPTGRYGWETYQEYFVDMSAWVASSPIASYRSASSRRRAVTYE